MRVSSYDFDKYLSTKSSYVKRRKALKHIGLGLSAGLWMPSLLSSCKKDDPGPEIQFDGTVAVIGAGAAGLYAADILNSRGVNVILFEASNQLGGRVRSLRNQRDIVLQTAADFPLELGADMVYGNDSSWGKILANYNLPHVETASSTERFILDNQCKAAADWAGDPDLEAVRSFVASLPGYSGGDVSMMQAAGVSTRAESLLNSMAGNYYGSSANLVSAKGVGEALSLREHDNVEFLVKTNPLQDILTSRFSTMISKVQLNTPIKTINYGGAKVILTDEGGTQYEVDKVIVTSSLAVLKSGVISFSPGLPGAKTASMSKLGMDHSLRVLIDFKKNFWGEDSGYLWGGTTCPGYFNSGVNRSEFYRTLSITIHGPKAAQLSAMGDGMLDAILAELDDIYDDNATLFIRKVINPDGSEGDRVWFKSDWGAETYIKGGMSYPKPGSTLQDRTNLGAPIGGKLFFAGEATDVKGDAGTVSGALNSAERVAEEVAESILSAS